MLTSLYDSPIGQLRLVSDAEGLRKILFPRQSETQQPPQHWVTRDTAFDAVKIQLDDYFTGKSKTFNLKLAPEGTDFQKKVWLQLQKIPYAGTTSYGQIAQYLGKPKASRAVGAANGSNPLPIVIPCHRVIGANGRLTGFAGGLAIKSWLLSHERGERQLFDLPTP